jgi:hypothetical protein
MTRMRHYLDPPAPPPDAPEPADRVPEPDGDVRLWLELGHEDELDGWHGTLEGASSGVGAFGDLPQVLHQLLIEGSPWRHCEIRVWTPASANFEIVGSASSADLDAVAGLVIRHSSP